MVVWFERTYLFLMSAVPGNNSRCQAVHPARFFPAATTPLLLVPPPKETPMLYIIPRNLPQTSVTLSFTLLP